ncbi:P-loop containing nucleoside triphosphate hydrolase [Sesbania bispinosa]|nr:P-loop containing nucleoside triphosphate hydrolase [Sesbania bispinosa]
MHLVGEILLDGCILLMKSLSLRSRAFPRDILPNGDKEAHAQAIANFGSQEDPEKLKLIEAAIKVQAASRGYLARREFQTLKGVIQLQAIIRGHLVRRQAVSALYCVKGIVKFQALARGYSVRRSAIGREVLKIRKNVFHDVDEKDTQCSNSIGVVTSTQAEKLSENVFVHKVITAKKCLYRG